MKITKKSAENLSKEESRMLESFFKDMHKKTESETARFRKQPDIENLYAYIIRREKERKARFEKLLLPLKIMQIISMICLGALAAFTLWTKRPEIASVFNKTFGIDRTSEKVSTALSGSNFTFILAATGIAMLILILFSYFTLRTDKSK